MEKTIHLNPVNASKKAKEELKKLSDLHKTSSLRNEKDVAMDFAIAVQNQFDRLIKATILFGSQAKKTAKPSSDIDVIVIIDDASINWDIELIAWYREELAKLISAKPYGKNLHINTVKLTTWWQDMLHGDPVIINILRSGEALIDSGGFFNPLKALLLEGKIYSTPEAVYAALQRAPAHLARSRASEAAAVEGIYWAMIDSAHAALMTAGKMPPSPEHIPMLLEETFVVQGKLKAEFPEMIREIYEMHKSITHGSLKEIRGSNIELWQANAEKFMLEMTRLIDILLQGK